MSNMELVMKADFEKYKDLNNVQVSDEAQETIGIANENDMILLFIETVSSPSVVLKAKIVDDEFLAKALTV